MIYSNNSKLVSSAAASSSSSSSSKVDDISLPNSKKCIWPLEKYFVHVANRLPQNPSTPLTVHCASKDDDLGFHKLAVNQEFQWHFCDNTFNTVFECSFWWDKSHAARFNVFDQTALLRELCNNNIPGQGKHTCYWEVKHDGFYLATPYGSRLLINLSLIHI